MTPRAAAAHARYRAAMHAVQSGVALKMNFNATDTEPKHLRTGVNAAMVDSAALATLLMGKGLFTEEEYYEALADAAEREKAAYATLLAEHYGRSVELA